MTNPLLILKSLPPFTHISVEHIEPAIEALLAMNRAEVQRILNAHDYYTWDNMIRPLEETEDRLNRAWAVVSHLNAVMNNDRLRAAYNACLPKLSDYATEMGQNERLYLAYKFIAEGPEYRRLDMAQKKIVDNALRDFRLSGIALHEQDQARYKEIMQELSKLSSQFSDNVLDATHAWSKQIDEVTQLQGLPATALALAQQTAQQRGLPGWLLTLDFPCYHAVITYADDRQLRREIYEAFVTRASDQGPQAGRWDNTPLMQRMLALRHEAAQLLGFANYAERSLATKMAASTTQVMDFLYDLARRSLPMARRELQEIRDFAQQHHGLAQLEAWDVAYYAEKLRLHKYAISQEDLKPYFPEPRVLAGMFEVVHRLYGISIKERKGVEVWHPDVHFYEIHDEQGRLRGQFYLDLYARQNKRGGAWMDECITRRRTKEGVQTPVAYLTCNFSPPLGQDPALFTHDEVETLFHEFGHGLHHMLTQVDYASVAGIGGVAWDAVELPSQFMENWCWQRESLNMITAHYQSGEPLPEEMFKRMLAAKNFQSGMQMVRQLEFAIFDFRIHLEHDPGQGERIMAILDEVRQQVAVMDPPSFNRFPHSFTHIFGGGYAAGYYSYKWAEVLSSDAFAQFEENGIFDRATGIKFLSTILEQGGSRDPMELFVDFRGREPQIDALLRHGGITAE